MSYTGHSLTMRIEENLEHEREIDDSNPPALQSLHANVYGRRYKGGDIQLMEMEGALFVGSTGKFLANT